MHEPEKIEVHFKRGVRPDGAIEEVCIRQYDNELRLTGDQARSLAKAINMKLGEAANE